jgi:uncharacterized membrane protein YidH (DUF202 family)
VSPGTDEGRDRQGPDSGANDRASRPFDVGLQPERTGLAWRRTALALTVAAVVGIRVLPALLGPWALIPAGAGIAMAVWILIASHHRYQQQHERLTTANNDRIPLPDGTLPALVTATAVLGGIACATAVFFVNLHQLT